MRTIAPAVVVAVWSSIAALQQPSALSATDAELIRRIRASDGPAIVALIKLEDVRKMQEFWGEAIQESTNPPLESFQFIGAWYSMRALDTVLRIEDHTSDLRKLRPVGDAADLTECYFSRLGRPGRITPSAIRNAIRLVPCVESRTHLALSSRIEQ